MAKQLLILEDDVAFAESLMRRLTKHQFVSHHATNISDALLLCHKHQPDYLVVDLNLQNASGLDFITPARSLLKQSKIILLTGFASIATAVQAIKLGADDYLTKPVDSGTLLKVLLGEGEKIQVSEAPMSPERLEWEHINQVLNANRGNISETARQLGMHRRTLQRKLQKKPSKE